MGAPRPHSSGQTLTPGLLEGPWPVPAPATPTGLHLGWGRRAQPSQGQQPSAMLTAPSRPSANALALGCVSLKLESKYNLYTSFQELGFYLKGKPLTQ